MFVFDPFGNRIEFVEDGLLAKEAAADL